jgi:hypothetical protein
LWLKIGQTVVQPLVERKGRPDDRYSIFDHGFSTPPAAGCRVLPVEISSALKPQVVVIVAGQTGDGIAQLGH